MSYLTNLNTGTRLDWTFGTSACKNSLYNRIVLTATGSGSIGSNVLETVLVNIKSPSILGTSHYFKIYLLSSNAIISRSYEYTINNIVTYTSTLQQIIIDNPSGLFSMNSASMKSFNIYTASSKVVAKENLAFSYSISSLNPTSGISISPFPLVLPLGSSSLTFFITCDSTVTPGDFVIKWSVESVRYLQPKHSLLKIDSSVLYLVTVSQIPTLYVGTKTIPIFVTSEAAPISTLLINPSALSGFTIPSFSIPAGFTKTNYTIAISSSLTAGSYPLSFSLQGDNSQYFYLDSSNVTLSVESYDSNTPSIISFVISSPRQKTFIDMTIQSSEPSAFYYTYGPRGLALPTNMTLISNSIAGAKGYYLGYTDYLFQYSFSVVGLIGEFDYILYGILADSNQNYGSLFTIDLSTADMDDSVLFTLAFTSSPSNSQLTVDVINALSYQFAVDSSRLSLSSFTNYTATYLLSSTRTANDPSPTNIVQFNAIASQINALLSGLQLKAGFDIDNTIVPVLNPKPTWFIYPSLTSTTKDSVTVGFSMTYSGTVHAEIISDSDPVPSSRQIVLGLDGYGNPAALNYSKTVIKEVSTTLEFGELVPTSSYTLVISAENNGNPNRYMDDSLMAVINFITQAGTVGSNSTNSTNSYASILSLSFFLFILGFNT